MAVEILLAPGATTMQEHRIAQWLAGDGDHVVEGQPLFSLEGRDPGQNVGAPATGTLKIIAATGKTYEAGTMLGYIE